MELPAPCSMPAGNMLRPAGRLPPCILRCLRGGSHDRLACKARKMPGCRLRARSVPQVGKDRKCPVPRLLPAMGQHQSAAQRLLDGIDLVFAEYVLKFADGTRER